MSVRVGCPFCNHTATLPAVPPGGRAACDRCGETFPVSGAVETTAEADPPRPPAAEPSPRLWLLALLPGVVALAVAAWVVFRPPAPAAVPPPPPASGPISWPPPIVPLLALLPADIGLAFAVQPGPLLAHAGRAGDDPQKLLAGLGVPDRVFTTLADAGLPLDRIDLLAGGLVFPADSAIPRAVVAVRPKPPATVAGVVEKLKATRMGVRDGGDWFHATVGGLPVALADRDGVLLVATWDDGLDQPRRPPGSGHLPAGLRDTLGQLSPSAFAWVAADAADWTDKPAVKAAVLILKRPELLERLKLVRSAAVGLSLEPELTVKATVKAAGDEAALRDKLAAAVAGKDVLVGGADGWVTLAAKPGELPRP